jgi:hypothetical protein
MKKFAGLVMLVTGVIFSQLSFAGLVGVYKSETDCKLTVEELGGNAGYADAKYSLRSDGTGACEWTGVGVGKRFKIEAGLVSQSSVAFAEVDWVFGPEGDKVEITYFDTDGSLRHKESFLRER